MKRITPKFLSLCVALTMALGMVGQITQSVGAAGTVSLTTFGSAYTQDFNTLATTGPANTMPTGWDFVETGTNANTFYSAGIGSGNSGDTWSFGAAASSERAFGGLQSGSLVPTIGAQFTNNTGGTITSLAIAYTGEMWRLGTLARVDRIDFQYSTDAPSLSIGTWLDVNSLDFSTTDSTGIVGARDGNSANFRTALNTTISSLSIANGATFWIRWVDFNATGGDDGLSVDDFSITPTGFMPDVAPSVASTTPTDTTTGVAINSDVTVTFSEAVNAAGSWYDLTCSTSGTHTVAVTGGPTTFSLNPGSDFANGETCTFTVYAAQITDQDTNDPPDLMASNYVMTFSTISAAPFISSITPIDGATGIGTQSNISITFNKQVSIDSGGITVVCTVTPAVGIAVSSSPATSFTVDPLVDFSPNETCTVTVLASYVHDTDTNDPPDTMAVDFTSTLTTDAIPTVTSTTPVDGATDVTLSNNIVVNFSEAMTASASSFNVTCTNTGTHTVVVSGSGTAAITLNPAVDFGNFETCTLTVNAAQISDADAGDPPNNLSADYEMSFTTANVCILPYTSAHSIQGSGASVALTGSQTTQGVVVGDFEGASPALRGFFIQELDANQDADPLTSEGLFVFEGSNANTVSIGDLVRVTGIASDNQGQSQVSVGTIVKCGTGTVTPTVVSLPVATLTTLEQYEGMLVTFPQQLFVSENFQLGRFGQVTVSGERLHTPTAIADPGAPATLVDTNNHLNLVIVDDSSQDQNLSPLFGRGGNPLSASNTLRGGDSITGLTGVMTYTWAGNAASGNAYRVRPVTSMAGYYVFDATNPRPTAPPAVGGTASIVGMNVLNYFNTFGSACSTGVGPLAVVTGCRGAESTTEFDRQWIKTVNAILAMNADVYGLAELENDGYGPTSAIQDLVNKLNASAGAGTYAFIDADALVGLPDSLGNDAIKVGIIYKPANVTPIGTTAALNTVAFVNGGDAVPRNRVSLLQAFEDNDTSAVFLVNVNHLKSKGCDTGMVAPDLQGCHNVVRVNAVNELMTWFTLNPTGIDDPDIVMLGDLNSYAKEDPIKALEAGGFINAAAAYLGDAAYSYVFDENVGGLDYAIVSPSFYSQTTRVEEWHVNADEPGVLDYNTNFKSAGQITSLYDSTYYRNGDHDPVVVGFSPDGAGPSALVTDPPDGATLDSGISQLVVMFSEDVVHDGGQYAADNTGNYMLVERGANHLFDTLTCEVGVQTDDNEITINNIVYDPETFTATLNINNGLRLGSGTYRLFICGTSTIRDLVGNALNNGEFDTFSTFLIKEYLSATGAATELPSTGFAPDRVTTLPAQTVKYSELGDLWLEIPNLNVKTSIVGVPQTGDTWDVTWLGSKAGWLAGSAYPTAQGNSVLTAHVWDALNKPGAFYALDKLGYGDQIIVHSYGKSYTYEVRRVMTVSPTNVDAMLKHQEDAWLTLVTCKGYSSSTDEYSYRTLVRAVLVGVK